nr:tetratricopeptide repeat protein [Bdellovibrionales bacterium]
MKWLTLILLFSAQAFAQDISKLEAALNRHPDQMSLRLQLAKAHEAAKQPDKVITTLNPYTDQLTPVGFLVLARAYSTKKDYANEVRVFKFLADKDETSFRWQMLMGQAYLKQAHELPEGEGRKTALTNGIRSLRRALALQSRFKPAYDLLLSTLLTNRANNEARELLMEGISKFGARPELYRELCRLDAQDGFLVQAVANCWESINVSPNYPDHYVYFIQALSDQKEDVRAEREVVKAAKKFPRSEFVQWAAGMLFLRQKNYPVASRYFRTAVAAQADSPRSRFGLAQALFENGSEEEALEHFVKACKADAKTHEAFMMAAGKIRQRGSSPLASKYSA